MGILLIAIAVVVIALLFSAFPSRSFTYKSEINPYFGKNPLTPTEAQFHELLVKALPEYIVLAQVQLSSFIGVDRFKTKQNFYTWFNPIAQQSVDYLICRRDFSVIAAVELDDKSHYSDDAILRDTKKNKNIAAAGVILIRWHAELMPSLEQIRQELFKENAPQRDVATDGFLSNEDQEAYFKRNQPVSDSLLRAIPAKALVGVVLIVALLWLFNGGTKQVVKSAQGVLTPVVQAHFQSQMQTMIDQQKLRASELAEKQAREKQAAESQKYADHMAKLAQQRAQVETQQKATEEANLREELWSQYYKKSPECAATATVSCGNEYISAQKKFDAQWDAGKRDLHSFQR